MKGIKDTSSDTFRKLFGNGITYKIPKFQRDYSWDTEQWDDLWQDLEALLQSEEEAHYMGYLVLQTSDNKSHLVIDGQQRLTTICILILTVLKHLKRLEEDGNSPEDNRKRREALLNSYIGYINPVTLIPNNKLELNRNNDRFYRNYLVPLEKIPQRGLNSSEKLMKNCFEWFYRRLNGKFKEGKDYAQFVDNIVDRLFFTVITVGDELNAFKVFETLNARGVQLSSSDLLKNYLFSVVDSENAHTEEIRSLDELWTNIVEKLRSEKLPEFLRVFWNSRNKTTRKTELFKTIKRNIQSKKEVFNLLRELNEKADIFIALKNPDDEFWKDKSEDIRKYLRDLKLFGVKQPTSLLIAAYDKLNISDFEQVLKICSTISFRYNIIGKLNPNEQEKAYNVIALKIQSKGSFSKNDFFSLYPQDSEFEADFANIEFRSSSRNTKIIKYILGNLEAYISQIYIDIEDPKHSIEHILPENPLDEWTHISDDELERTVNRLGNLTLLEKGINNQIGNENFDKKLEVYSKSRFEISKLIASTYTEWDEAQISKRQRWMARQAKTIWRLNF